MYHDLSSLSLSQALEQSLDLRRFALRTLAESQQLLSHFSGIHDGGEVDQIE